MSVLVKQLPVKKFLTAADVHPLKTHRQVEGVCGEKCTDMSWVRYVARVGEKWNAYTALIGWSGGWRPVGRAMLRQWSSVIVDVKQYQYCSVLGTSVLAHSGDVEGMVHSEVMPIGTDPTLNGTVRHREVWKLDSEEFIPRCSRLSFNMTLFELTHFRDRLKDFSALDSPDLAPSDFRPCPRFKNVSEDVTTLRKVKLGQRVCCESLTKLHSCIATHWWRYLRVAESP